MFVPMDSQMLNHKEMFLKTNRSSRGIANTTLVLCQRMKLIFNQTMRKISNKTLLLFSRNRRILQITISQSWGIMNVKIKDLQTKE